MSLLSTFLDKATAEQDAWNLSHLRGDAYMQHVVMSSPQLWTVAFHGTVSAALFHSKSEMATADIFLAADVLRDAQLQLSVPASPLIIVTIITILDRR